MMHPYRYIQRRVIQCVISVHDMKFPVLPSQDIPQSEKPGGKSENSLDQGTRLILIRVMQD